MNADSPSAEARERNGLDSETADRTLGHFAPMAEARQQALDGCRTVLVNHFREAGYRLVDTPLLFPSNTFLDFSGEGIRGHLYLTTDGEGRELCLRPEFTIPVCLAYLNGGGGGKQAEYAYCGPVFRTAQGGPGQRIQSGLESFGRPDTAAADAEVLVRSVLAADAAGFKNIDVRLGDAGLLARLLEVLEVPAHWQRRLKRGLERGLGAAVVREETPAATADHSGVIAALSGADQRGARALVEDLLSIAGIVSVGGRSAGEIADRFLNQVADRASPAFGVEQRQILERYLSIVDHPDDAALELRRLASAAKLDLEAALDLFDERTNFLAVHELSVERIVFDAAFARNLDYYTGFVFEARHAPRTGQDPAIVIGGGRYDRLAQALGSADPVAAVGASIWVDRLSPAAEPADA